MNLFLDTSNNKLILILEKDNQIIDSLFIDNQIRISDIALDELTKFLNKNNLTIHEIKGLYATKGPGSYTGVRVAITIIKTLKTINENFEVFLISSLAFQASNKKCISLIDAKGNKYYMGVYDQGKNIIEDQLIPAEYIDEFKNQFKDFEEIKDYNDIEFEKSFLNLKNYFCSVKVIADINPLYIKHFI